MKELPDSIRVPLDEVWADADYLFGRVLADAEFKPAAVQAVKRRIDAAKAAMRSHIHGLEILAERYTA